MEESKQSNNAGNYSVYSKKGKKKYKPYWTEELQILEDKDEDTRIVLL